MRRTTLALVACAVTLAWTAPWSLAGDAAPGAGGAPASALQDATASSGMSLAPAGGGAAVESGGGGCMPGGGCCGACAAAGGGGATGGDGQAARDGAAAASSATGPAPGGGSAGGGCPCRNRQKPAS